MASTGTGMSFFLFSILLVVRFSQVHCFGEKVRSASPARSCSPPSGTGKCSLTEGQSLLQLQRLNGGTSLEKAQQRAEIEEPEWEAVNGGTDQACRGAKPSDNSADYYTLHPGTKSVDACQALCLEDSVSCVGVEYSAAGGLCELWTRPGGIAASATVSGYTCLRLIYAAEFSLVDGGENRACRGADSLDNSNSYYLLRFGLGSIDACKQACARELSCKGIEYHLAGGGRCELWTRDRGIEASIRNEGYNCLSFVRTDGATALPSQPPAEPSCKPFAEWPDVDKVTCSGCRALVLTAPYGGRCDSYCGSFGHVCLAAAEEVNENCAVKYTARCDEQIAGTSDMLCTCGYAELPSSSTTPPSTASSSTSSAPAATETTTQATTTPIRVTSTSPPADPSDPSGSCCSPFSLWPQVDNGITCDSCTALVLTEPYGGRCDQYCESFGHVCVAAAEEEDENCAVKYVAECDVVIAGTSDMLCTCHLPRDAGSCLPEPPAPPTSTALNILTWNPHWECFSSGHWISENCKQGATDYLNQLLVQGVDFANIVELMDDSYQAPAGYGMLHSTCRWDRTTLMWNQATWTAVGEPTRGCMEAYKPDRSFIVQVFEHRGNSGMRLAVVGAHFPHGSLDRLEGINELGNAIRNTGIDKVIFAADVNQEQYVSSTSIMQRMGVPNAASSVSTELLPSCCKNDGFSHTYDRVIANFGAAMGTTMLMDPLPEFASTGTWAFHKGMLGKLQVPTLAMA